MSSYIYEVVKTEPDIPVRCFSYCDPVGYSVPAHWHNSIEILRIQTGRMKVTLGEKALVLEEGCFLIINSREIHSTFCEKGTVAEVVQIPLPFLKKYLPEMDGRSFCPEPVYGGMGEKDHEKSWAGAASGKEPLSYSDFTYHVLNLESNKMKREMGWDDEICREGDGRAAERGQGHEWMGKGEYEKGEDSKSEGSYHANRIGWLLNKLNHLNRERGEAFLVQFHSFLFELIYLLHVCCSVQKQESMIRQDDMNRERLTLVMNYVNQNYKEHITLDQAASLVALNKEYFCRFFRKNMGMSFVDYVNEVRFSHVCEELFTSDRSIMALLEENGFTNYKLFMKMFRSRYHTTPSRKRREV